MLEMNQMCLERLPHLSSIVIADRALITSILFDFLKLFPNLLSVKVSHFANAWDDDDKDLPEEEKLVVSDLSFDCGDFWRIFRVDRLEKLAVSFSKYTSEEDVTTFCGVVERCQRLEQLVVEIYTDDSSLFPPLLRLAEVLPHLKPFNLNLRASSIESVAQIARRYPSVEKFVKKLTICDPEPTGDRIDPFL